MGAWVLQVADAIGQLQGFLRDRVHLPHQSLQGLRLLLDYLEESQHHALAHRGGAREASVGEGSEGEGEVGQRAALFGGVFGTGILLLVLGVFVKAAPHLLIVD